MIITEAYVYLLFGLGAMDIAVGTVVILRRRSVEAWVRRQYARLEERERTGDGLPTEYQWIPGRRAVVGCGVALIVVGTITVGVGLVAGQ